MIIRLIHGIHSPEGNNNIEAFTPILQAVLPGDTVAVFSYGFMGFWQARFRNAGVAKRLAAASSANPDEPEVWVTHSNGAAIAYLAATRYNARPAAIINFNPALDRWRVAPVPWVETIHSNQDRWVNLSRFLPGHLWGDQGKIGIAATTWHSPEHHNYTCHNASKFGSPMAYDDHNGAFTLARRGNWALFLADRINQILLRG